MKQQFKKILTIILSVLIGFGIFSIIIGFTGFDKVFEILSKSPLFPLIMFVILSFFIDGFLALRWHTILRHMGFKVKYVKTLIYRWMGYAVSYSTPAAHVGGEPVRAFMLKKEGLETTDAFSSVILDKSIEMAGYIIFSAIGLFMVLLTYNIASSFTYIAMFLALAITAFLIFVFFTKLKRNERMFVKWFKKLRLDRFKFVKKFIHKVEEVEISMSAFMNHGSKGFHQCVTITLMLWVFMYVEYYFGLKMIGISPSLSGIFLIGVFIAISYAVPIPGALGVLEAGQVSIFTILGYSPSQAIAFALLIRARDVMRTLIGYLFLSHSGVKFFKFFTKDDKK